MLKESGGQGGVKYLIESRNDYDANAKYTLTIERNYSKHNHPAQATNPEANRYYLTTYEPDGDAAGISLNDEQMLELFAAYLAVKEEYDGA